MTQADRDEDGINRAENQDDIPGPPTTPAKTPPPFREETQNERTNHGKQRRPSGQGHRNYSRPTSSRASSIPDFERLLDISDDDNPADGELGNQTSDPYETQLTLHKLQQDTSAYTQQQIIRLLQNNEYTDARTNREAIRLDKKLAWGRTNFQMVAESLKRKQSRQAFRRANKLLTASNVPSTRLLARASLPSISAWSAEQFINKGMPYCTGQNFATIKKSYSERFQPASLDGECGPTLLVFLQELEADIDSNALCQEQCIGLLRARFKPEYYSSDVKAYFILHSFHNAFLELASDLGRPLTEAQRWQKVYRFRFGRREHDLKKDITTLRGYLVTAMNFVCSKKQIDQKILDTLIPQLHVDIAQWLSYQCENYHSLSIGHDLDERLSSSDQLDKLIDLAAQKSKPSESMFLVNSAIPAQASRGLFAISQEQEEQHSSEGATCCNYRRQDTPAETPYYPEPTNQERQSLQCRQPQYEPNEYYQQEKYLYDTPPRNFQEQETRNVNQVGQRNVDATDAQQYQAPADNRYNTPPPQYSAPNYRTPEYNTPPHHEAQPPPQYEAPPRFQRNQQQPNQQRQFVQTFRQQNKTPAQQREEPPRYQQQTSSPQNQGEVEYITFKSGKITAANKDLIATRTDDPKRFWNNSVTYYARKNQRNPRFPDTYVGEHSYQTFPDGTYLPSRGPINCPIFKRIHGGNPLLTNELVDHFSNESLCTKCGEPRCSNCIYRNEPDSFAICTRCKRGFHVLSVCKARIVPLPVHPNKQNAKAPLNTYHGPPSGRGQASG